MAVKKAYTIGDIEKREFNMLPLQGEWKRHLGDMERSGSILILGDSGDGKTTYALQVAKTLCEIEKVHYNSAEEGIKASFKRSLLLNNMKAVRSKFKFSKESYDELTARLQMKRQSKIIIIDSLQYFFRGKTVKDYYNLVETFADTLFIFISHIKKGRPEGAVGNEVYWDCQNRILVKDFKAHIQKSRCGADEAEPYIINERIAADREIKLVNEG
jgi:Cdc6-like AAA superfamily ATPase